MTIAIINPIANKISGTPSGGWSIDWIVRFADFETTVSSSYPYIAITEYSPGVSSFVDIVFTFIISSYNIKFSSPIDWEDKFFDKIYVNVPLMIPSFPLFLIITPAVMFSFGCGEFVLRDNCIFISISLGLNWYIRKYSIDGSSRM